MKSALFDPFGDFATAGYLRNVRQDKDPRIIKRFEHDLFEANIDTALAFLASCAQVTYADFCEVHRIIFADYYPWAGRDRVATAPDIAVHKGEVLFAHPHSARLAVEQGLHLGLEASVMASRPGEVMGLFAYGHPFLDGNGRTMLLVHMELCHRAGLSIAWERTSKAGYLTALTQEIETSGLCVLDNYLTTFTGPRLERGTWGSNIHAIKGLDGMDGGNQIDGNLSDPLVAERYRRFDEKRGYTYTPHE